MTNFIKKHWVWIVLLLVLSFGMFFRFWALSEIPPGVYPDEAKNANDAVDTLLTGDYQLFYTENNGREGLFMWLIAWSFQAFGISVFGLKFVSALAGSLSILGTYLATKELLRYSTKDNGLELKFKLSKINIETASLLAAGFLATSFWHINFSRIAFRASLVPLLISFGLYFTFKTLRTKKLLPALAAGVVWGAGFYTYIAFRMAILIPFGAVALAFIAYMIKNRPRLNIEWLKSACKEHKWWKVSALFVSMGATMAPLLISFYKHPEYFISRSSGISVFDAASPVVAFLKSLALHIQMLFFVGDANWRHNFSGEAQLAAPVAVMFAAGLIYSAIAILSGAKRKHWNSLVVHLTLLGGSGLMLLPAVLTTEGVPHALRAIGLMPFVFIYAALGFLYIVRLVFPHKHHREEIWPFVFGSALIIIMLLSSYQFTHYFAQWGRNEHVQGAFSKPYVEVGRYFNTASEQHKYLVINDGGVLVTYPNQIISPFHEGNKLPMAAQTTLFIQRTHDVALENTTYIMPDELPISANNSVFVPLVPREDIKDRLRNRYPQGIEVEIENLWIYKIE